MIYRNSAVFSLIFGIIFISSKAFACSPETIQKAFSNLGVDQRVQYHQIIADVDQRMAQHKLFSALIKLNEARNLFSLDPGLSLRAAQCYSLLENYKVARIHYQHTLKLEPSNFTALNNLVEISFTQKNWKQCLLDIENLATKQPAMASRYPLLALKQLVCLDQLTLEKEYQAFHKIVTKNYTYMSDTPLIYYVQALDLLRENRKMDAELQIASAFRIFKQPKLHQAWSRALVEAEYLSGYEINIRKVRKDPYRKFNLD